MEEGGFEVWVGIWVAAVVDDFGVSVADEDGVETNEANVELEENAEVAEADVDFKDVTSQDDRISQDSLQSMVES